MAAEPEGGSIPSRGQLERLLEEEEEGGRRKRRGKRRELEGEWNEQGDWEQGIDFLQEGTAHAKAERYNWLMGGLERTWCLSLGSEGIMRNETGEGSKGWVL